MRDESSSNNDTVDDNNQNGLSHILVVIARFFTKKELEEKLEKKLPYKPYGYGIIWSSIVFILSFIAFIAFIYLWDKIQIENIVKIIALCLVSLLTICSIIFYTITLIKDDCGIRFAKLNELARISEKIDSCTLLKDPLNICLKYNEKTSSETENTGKLEKVTIEEKNYKFELYKKYMDTLADI